VKKSPDANFTAKPALTMHTALSVILVRKRLSWLNIALLLTLPWQQPVYADYTALNLSAETKQNLSYQIEINLPDHPQLSNMLEEASTLLKLTDHPPHNLVALERRIRNDLDLFRKILRSEGYYSSKLNYQIETTTTPLQIAIDITPGPQYHITQYLLEYLGPGTNNAELPNAEDDLNMVLNQPARAQLVVDARKKILNILANTGHPLSSIIDETIIVDHATNSMRITLKISPGPIAYIGPLRVEGMSTVDRDYIRDFTPWKVGDLFSQSLIDSLRNQLLATGLFAEVAIERPNQLNTQGELPITVRVVERKHRSISLGARWSTDEGFSGDIQWEHRNLLGRQERLSLKAELGEVKQEFNISFIKPHFLSREQNLSTNAALTHENMPAYTGPVTYFSLGLQRPFATHWQLFIGLPVEYSNLKDFHGNSEFALLGLDARADRDTTDTPFNPSAGTRLRLSLEPYISWGDNQIAFVRSTITASAYHALMDNDRWVLAGRIKLGSLLGENTNALPANKRYYAGGGASIRGYGLQLVGPLGPGIKPLGGRSLFEIGAELRIRVTDSIGGILFFDGGNVYDNELPNLFGRQQWAAGLGVRYFTAAGPIRLDFGFPLNPREGIDDLMQFYLSIGQAF
jgi:translocation and assembly module TamA